MLLELCEMSVRYVYLYNVNSSWITQRNWIPPVCVTPTALSKTIKNDSRIHTHTYALTEYDIVTAGVVVLAKTMMNKKNDMSLVGPDAPK